MKNLLRAALVGALFAPAIQADAQQLTRAQAGQVAVAQCYAHCTEVAYGDQIAALRFTLDALEGEWDALNVLLEGCVVVQNNAIAGDMCKAGCFDIEHAYGVRTGRIRSRFGRALNEYVRDVRTAGLWTAWNRYPEPGTDAFVQACARFWEIQTRKNTAAVKSWEKLSPMSDEEFKARRQEVIENERYPEPLPAWEDWD